MLQLQCHAHAPACGKLQEELVVLHVKQVVYRAAERALLSIGFISGVLVGVWLCSEERLGRVGTLVWTCLSTAVLVLCMALTLSHTAFFAPVSVLALFCIGEAGFLEFNCLTEPCAQP